MAFFWRSNDAPLLHWNRPVVSTSLKRLPMGLVSFLSRPSFFDRLTGRSQCPSLMFAQDLVLHRTRIARNQMVISVQRFDERLAMGFFFLSHNSEHKAPCLRVLASHLTGPCPPLIDFPNFSLSRQQISPDLCSRSRKHLLDLLPPFLLSV